MADFDYSGMDPRVKKYGITAEAIEARAKELQAYIRGSDEERARMAVRFLCDSVDLLMKYGAHVTWS